MPRHARDATDAASSESSDAGWSSSDDGSDTSESGWSSSSSESSDGSPKRSPAPRSAAFASLSRMRFTRDAVSHMLTFVRAGALPLAWSRARAWKFTRQMERHRWRIVRKVGQGAAASAAAGGAAASAAAGGAAAGGAAAAGGSDDALEVLVPDPSADARALPRPRLVWLQVVPEESVDAALHALYTDPAQGSLRGAKAGLRPGERIAVTGPQRVRPGGPVAPEPVPMAQKSELKKPATELAQR